MHVVAFDAFIGTHNKYVYCIWLQTKKLSMWAEKKVCDAKIIRRMTAKSREPLLRPSFTFISISR